MNLCFQREDREFSIQDKPPKTRSTKKTGQILKEFRNVIISAYPKKINLKMMDSDELDENLDLISTGENIEEVVFELIQWAKSKNKLEQLVKAACESNPGNQQLQRISKELFPNLLE